MKQVIEFLKKYKIHILSSLLFIFVFKSCGKSTELSRLEKVQASLINKLDSLSNSSDSILKLEKLNHSNDIEFIDTWIKQQNRGPQLMELQTITDSLLKQSNKND